MTTSKRARNPTAVEARWRVASFSAALRLKQLYAHPNFVIAAAKAVPSNFASNAIHSPAVSSNDSSSPASQPISPSQMQRAYGSNSITFGNTAGNGAGQTIAIVDAYADPNAASDLATFDSTYGLAAPPSFSQRNEFGGSASHVPSGNGWDLEESLDIEWVHVIAPAASIILYEANSNSFSDLFTAVQTAARNNSVSVVSMSWGGGEFPGETTFDSTFTTPANHTSGGVTFCASTGDSGAPAEYPAYSPNVVAVGGTTLLISDSAGDYFGENAWSGGGGGSSTQESIPIYQTAVQSSKFREAPDVSMDAHPSSGVPVYDSLRNGGWFVVGGTSVSCPMFAGLIAIADQGRVQYGLRTLDGPSQTLPYLYQMPSNLNFHDITAGNNGFPAGPGYDRASGIGSPIANQLVSGFALPEISSVGESDGPLIAGGSISLTATTNDVNGTVSSVSFYLESNGGAGLQIGPGGDTFLGMGISNGSGGWTFSISTMSGSQTYYAVAADSVGATSLPYSTTISIQATPVVTLSGSNADPSDATQPLTFTATVAGGVPDGETITLEDDSNNDVIVATGALSGGIATLNVPAGTLLAGDHDLIAVYAGDDNFAPTQSSPLNQTVQVIVTNAVINGNIPSLGGAQRSMVDSIVYTFSEAVNLDPDSAFAIAVNSIYSSGALPTLSWAALNPGYDGSSTQWVVTFSGLGVLNGSISDGVYDVNLNGSAVTSDANPAVNAQSRTDTFYRLFGDAQGIGAVCAADYNALLSTFEMNSSPRADISHPSMSMATAESMHPTITPSFPTLASDLEKSRQSLPSEPPVFSALSLPPSNTESAVPMPDGAIVEEIVAPIVAATSLPDAASAPPEANRTKRAAWSYASNVLYAVVTMFVGLWSTPILIRLLNNDRFGAVRAATDVFGYVSLLELGLGGATLAMLTQAIGRGDLARTRLIVREAVRSYGVLTILMMVASIILGLFIVQLVGVPARHEKRIATRLLHSDTLGCDDAVDGLPLFCRCEPA